MRKAYPDFVAQVEEYAEKQNLNLSEVARRAGLRDNALYTLRSSEPKIGRVEAICRALGLEFYIGPPRDEGASSGPPDDQPGSDLTAQSVAQALPPDLARYLDLPEGASVAEAVQAIEARAATTPLRNDGTDAVRAEIEDLRDEIMSQIQSLTDAADPPAARPKPDPALLERLANVASTIFRDANVSLPPASLTAEATIMFNDLAARVSDLSDPDEIALAMPLVKYNLSKRLKDARANPGAGKCGA